jgi:hypothetical protein
MNLFPSFVGQRLTSVSLLPEITHKAKKLFWIPALSSALLSASFKAPLLAALAFSQPLLTIAL